LAFVLADETSTRRTIAEATETISGCGPLLTLRTGGTEERKTSSHNQDVERASLKVRRAIEKFRRAVVKFVDGCDATHPSTRPEALGILESVVGVLEVAAREVGGDLLAQEQLLRLTQSIESVRGVGDTCH
jgi:hypothetical protein